MVGNYYIYITTNPGKTVLYTGITNDLLRRSQEHYNGRGNKKTFTGRYYCYNLIYYEHFKDVDQAIFREKEIKNMTRKKKEDLINSINPNWNFIKVI